MYKPLNCNTTGMCTDGIKSYGERRFCRTARSGNF